MNADQTVTALEAAVEKAREKRAAQVAGLRELADFLESKPAVPFAGLGTQYVHLGYDADAAELLKTTARALGSFDKRYTESDFRMTKKFGPIEVVWYIGREQTCVKKVVGTRKVPSVYIPEREEEIVEWDCTGDPLLAPTVLDEKESGQ